MISIKKIPIRKGNYYLGITLSGVNPARFNEIIEVIRSIPCRKRYQNGTWRIYPPITISSYNQFGFLASLEGADMDRHARGIIAELKRKHDSKIRSYARAHAVKHNDQDIGSSFWNVKTTPWEHQRKAVRFISALDGSLLWLGMGTGKTKVIIDYINNYNCQNVLILCPKAVVQVWPHEFRKHSYFVIEPLVLQGSSKEIVDMLDENLDRPNGHIIKYDIKCDNPRIFVLNYDMAWRPNVSERLLSHPWDLVCLDEVHRIKSPGSKISKFCEKLAPKAMKRVGLSGTPIPNGAKDAFSIFRFLEPSLFGNSYTKFLDCYAKIGPFSRTQVVGYKNMSDFKNKMEQVTLHIGSQVLNLPPKIHATVPVKMPEAVYMQYLDMRDDLVVEVSDRCISVDNVLGKIQKMQQLASGFIYEGNAPFLIHTAKVEAMTELLSQIGDQPVVIFYGYKPNLKMIREACGAMGLRVGEISGDRNQYHDFRAGKVQIVAAQIQAAAEGIDLTWSEDRQCSHAIYFSLPYLSPAVYEQSLKRIHRPGQKETTYYHHIQTMDTIDEDIYRSYEEKKDLVEIIRSYMLKPKTT